MNAKNLTERADQVRAAFSGNYRAYQYRFVEFFTEHLADLSRTFGGDLQQMIILAIIGQVQMRAMHAAAAAGEDPRRIPPERVSIAASRIADVTGIPRETVRRKLSALQRKGWIEKSPASAWRLVVNNDSVPARVDLNEPNERAIVRISRLFAELETLL
jgi:DNA-binding MarR family transcriptional regulator